jgi:hypothetical protein
MLHVEPGQALGQVVHYIHLNPVRAGIVKVEELLGYRWSSLPWFAGQDRRAFLTPDTVLAESGGLADTAAGWRLYLDYLGVIAEEDAKRRDRKFGRLSRGWAIGSGDFKADLREKLSAHGAGPNGFELLGADRQAQREAQAELWEERLRRAAAALGVALDSLSSQKSAIEKVRLAAIMKLATSVSNGWLAARLQMGEPASVSQYVRRFRLRGGTEQRAFKVALSTIHT